MQLFEQNFDIILASASPRRQQYLKQLGLAFSIQPAEIDETPLPEETPRQFVKRMAKNKLKQVADFFPASCVISADTIVCLNNTIFGKPKNKKQALETLQLLNGRTHEVITGVCVSSSATNYYQTFDVESRVTFGQFSEELLRRYIDTGDPFDKAGGYGIQSFGGFLIESIEGSYSNIVGLPVTQLINSLLGGKIIK